jgi:hypothetical protein
MDHSSWEPVAGIGNLFIPSRILDSPRSSSYRDNVLIVYRARERNIGLVQNGDTSAAQQGKRAPKLPGPV